MYRLTKSTQFLLCFFRVVQLISLRWHNKGDNSEFEKQFLCHYQETSKVFTCKGISRRINRVNFAANSSFWQKKLIRKILRKKILLYVSHFSTVFTTCSSYFRKKSQSSSTQLSSLLYTLSHFIVSKHS